MNVEIIEKPFSKGDTFTDKTAIITLIHDNGTIETKEYGVIEKDTINQAISSGEKIILDNCYLDYLDLNGITVNTLSARDAFFYGNLDLGSTTFNGTANFSKATCDCEVNFSQATFKADTIFTETTFCDSANFYGANFEGSTGFRGTTFENKANLGSSTFKCYVNFSFVKFNGETSFVLVNFGGEVNFYRATFMIGAGFSATTFTSNMDFTCESEGEISFEVAKFFGHVNMQKLSCKKMNFNGCTLEKTLNLCKAKISQLSLIDLRNFGLIYIRWQQDNVKFSILNYDDEGKKTYHHELAIQFRLLKENLKNLGQYDDEDAAYVAFRRQEALSKLYMENEPNKGWRNVKRILYSPIAFLKWFVTDLIGEYATNPLRIALALIANILVFGLIYWLIGDVEVTKLPNIHAQLIYWYFSAITSFTVGYGIYLPSLI